VVTKYIASQEEHHKQHSFQEQFLAFLKKNGIAYEEKYIWDLVCFAPTGLGLLPKLTHGLRRGLHYFAAPRLALTTKS